MNLEPLFTISVTSAALVRRPILCTTDHQATRLVEELVGWHLITEGDLTPCCRNNNTPCARDAYEPTDLDYPTEILMRAAIAHGIPWPADLGQTEPEYSVLPHDNYRPGEQ